MNSLTKFREMEELRKELPEVDFTDWDLVDVQGWSSYEEGGTYWLFHHTPTDDLYQLDYVSSVYQTGPLILSWDDKFKTTLADWIILADSVDYTNEQFQGT